MKVTLSDNLFRNRIIANACERIRKGKAKPIDWEILNHHASPRLVQGMVREVCLRNAGIEPYPWLKEH